MFGFTSRRKRTWLRCARVLLLKATLTFLIILSLCEILVECRWQDWDRLHRSLPSPLCSSHFAALHSQTLLPRVFIMMRLFPHSCGLKYNHTDRKKTSLLCLIPRGSVGKCTEHWSAHSGRRFFQHQPYFTDLQS